MKFTEITGTEERPLTSQGIDGIVERLSQFMLALAGLGIVFMALATAYEVVLRYVFKNPTVWSSELCTYALIATIFFGASYAQLAGAHVRVDLLLNRLTGRRRALVVNVGAWLAILFVAITAWQSWLSLISDYRTGARVMGLLLTPTYLPKLPIAIGLTALVATLLMEALQGTKGMRANLTWTLVVVVLPLLLFALGTQPPLISGTKLDWGSAVVLTAVLAGALVSGGWRVLLAVGCIVTLGSAGLAAATHIGLSAMVLVIVALLAITLTIGVRIAFALGFAGLCGVYFLTPLPFPITVAERAWNSVNSFALTAVPMYVLMGALLINSGLSRELFAVMARILARLPGGLAHAGIVGSAIFAAISGSSVATAATMGTVACPEMTKRGYDNRLAYGSIAAGGTLGILIPPSVPMIIYGITVGVPITSLFMAGIVPGLLLVLLFLGIIFIWALIDRKAAPAQAPADRIPLTLTSLIDSAIVMALIGIIIFSLYGGIATPSEIGAFGAIVAFIACLLRKRLTTRNVMSAIQEAVLVTSFIFVIVIGANILTFCFDYLKVAEQLMQVVTSAHLNRWVVLTMIMVLYLILGMFLDSISMLLLTLPVVFPLSQQLGFDPVWLGIILVVMAEVGLVTPPVGMNLFVMQGISRDVPIRDIALGAAPFIGAMLILVALLSVFPGIALWLTY